jgi:Mce-associated membrane protein
VIALALVATSVVLLGKGASASPGEGRAQSLSRQYAAVSRAARAETLAFLDVDYRHMDPLVTKVLAGATGSFKAQYQKSTATLKASAERSRAVSTGRVAQVGISEIGDRRAVVLVAADAQVTNRTTKGSPQPRYYRLRLTLERHGGTWLTSDLRFVG